MENFVLSFLLYFFPFLFLGAIGKVLPQTSHVCAQRVATGSGGVGVGGPLSGVGNGAEVHASRPAVCSVLEGADE